MHNEKEKAIVFCGTSNMIFAIANVLIGMNRNFPKIADRIVIITDKGIKRRDKKILNELFSIEYIRYKFPIKDISIFNKGTYEYFTKMVFAKFECLKLLEKYRTILFLDYDQVIIGDISNLFNNDDFGMKIIPNGSPIRNQLHNEFREMNLEKYNLDFEGMCASTIVFNDNIPYMEMYKYCYDKLEQYAKYLFTPEQFIFDLMIQEFNILTSDLKNDEYSLHPDKYYDNADVKILHSYGGNKFWNSIANIDWNINNNIWLSHGGTPYIKKSKSMFLLYLLQRIKKRIFWK